MIAGSLATQMPRHQFITSLLSPCTTSLSLAWGESVSAQSYCGVGAGLVFFGWWWCWSRWIVDAGPGWLGWLRLAYVVFFLNHGDVAGGSGRPFAMKGFRDPSVPKAVREGVFQCEVAASTVMSPVRGAGDIAYGACCLL